MDLSSLPMTVSPSPTTKSSLRSSLSSSSSSSSALKASTSQFSPWSRQSLACSNLLCGVWSVVLLLTASANGEMHINKCCGVNEQLHDYLRGCVPYESASAAALAGETFTDLPTTAELSTTAEFSTATESVSNTTLPTTTVLPTTIKVQSTGSEGGLPFWIDPDLTVLDTHSHRPLEGAEAWAGAQLGVGGRGCDFADTHYVFSKRREMYQLLSNGSLLLPMWRTNADGRGRTQIQVAFPPTEWCMDRVDREQDTFVFLACPCQRVTCLNRCCNMNQMFRAEMGRRTLRATCAKVENATALRSHPVFYAGQRPLNATEDAEDKGGVVYTELYAHTIQCDPQVYAKYLLNSHYDDDKDKIWLQRNGSVIIQNYNHYGAFERHHVCHVEILTTDGEAMPDLFFCHKRKTEEKPGQENVFYSLLFLVGAFFLLLTLVVHALVPELRRSAHAKALMCHCATLLVASVVLTVGHLARVATQPFCSMSAYLVQFFFLSTFFWLNVMCFDLSWTFGAMRRRRVPSVGGDRGRRFLWYSLYAWGCPALISAITIFLDFAPVVPPDLPLLPNVGARKCWFDTKYATFAYYYGPMLLLLVVNLVLFVFTVVRIKHSRRGTSILRRGSANARTQGGASGTNGTNRTQTSTATTPAGTGTGDDGDSSTDVGGGRTDSAKVSETAAKTAAMTSSAKIRNAMKSGDRQMLIVFTKLFCLMGVTWVTEIVSWAAGDDTFAVWYITDAINMLRGVLIFFFFCCKPSALRPLKARVRTWCPWALRLGPSKKRPRVSISTLESSLSMPDIKDSTTTAIGPAAPGAASAMNVRDDAL